MIRILHTADWHLGVRLHKKELPEDHQLFFDWLIELIKDRKIDVLLISGDVFDHSNPSAEARQLYYSFLTKLIEVKCKVIITGGNHDSPVVLNAPRPILKMLDVHVLGNVPQNKQDQVICLHNKNGEVEAVVCAVPFLRDSEIRTATEGETYSQKGERRKTGMKEHFDNVINYCNENFKEIPVILMAHLFAQGAETSDHEREITIGGQDLFLVTDFPKGCHYIALGHMHRPQTVSGNGFIRYSGSPIPLSFSEKADQKLVIEITVANDSISEIITHPIPASRRLLKFTGALQQVENQLRNFKNDLPLIAFAELEIQETSVDLQLPVKVHRLVTDFQSKELEILNYKYNTVATTQTLDDLVPDQVEIHQLSELEVLEKMMESQQLQEEQKRLVTEAFTELLQLVNSER